MGSNFFPMMLLCQNYDSSSALRKMLIDSQNLRQGELAARNLSDDLKHISRLTWTTIDPSCAANFERIRRNVTRLSCARKITPTRDSDENSAAMKQLPRESKLKWKRGAGGCGVRYGLAVEVIAENCAKNSAARERKKLETLRDY